MNTTKITLVGVFILCFAPVLTGCAHHVSADYPQYVNKHKNDQPLPDQAESFPAINRDGQYFLTNKTENHNYSFRSWQAGILNSWVVEFGPMLEAHLQSEQFQTAFNELVEVEKKAIDSDGLFMTYDLKDYRFANENAHIKLRIVTYQNGNKIIDKIYESSGQGQSGKMFFGGAFAMKNAVQQSTIYAINEILYDYLIDLQKTVR